MIMSILKQFFPYLMHSYILRNYTVWFWHDQERNRYYCITSNPAQSPSGVPVVNKAKHQPKVKSNNEERLVDNVAVTIEMSHCPLLEKLQQPSCNDGDVDMTKLLMLD